MTGLTHTVRRAAGRGERWWWLLVVAIAAAMVLALAWWPFYGLVAALALCLGTVLTFAWRQAVIALLLTVPLEAYFIPAGGLRLKLYQLIALAIVPGFVIAVSLGQARFSIPLLPPLLMLLGFSGLSIVYSIAPDETLRVVFLQTMLLVVFCVVSVGLQDGEHYERAILALVVVGAVVALFGIYQLFAWRIGLPTGISQTVGEGRPWKYLTRYGRPSGTFFEPDWYGAYMMLMLLQALPFSVGGPPRWRRAATLAAVALALGLLVSGTRAAWLGFAVGVVSLFLFRSTARLRVLKMIALAAVLIAALLAVLALTYAPYFAMIVERGVGMFSTQSHGVEGRLNTLEVVTDQIARHPYFGSGTGVLDHLVQGWGKAMAGRLGPNVFLTTWMEIGIVGGVLLLWLFVALFVHVGRAALEATRWAYLAQGSFAAALGLLVQSQFNNSFLLGFFWMQLALCSAAIGLVRRETSDAPDRRAEGAATPDLPPAATAVPSAAPRQGRRQ